MFASVTQGEGVILPTGTVYCMRYRYDKNRKTTSLLLSFSCFYYSRNDSRESSKEQIWCGDFIQHMHMSLFTNRLSGFKRWAAHLNLSLSLFFPALPTDEGPPLPCMKLRVTVCCEPSEYTPLFICSFFHASPFQRLSLPLLFLLSGLKGMMFILTAPSVPSSFWMTHTF